MFLQIIRTDECLLDLLVRLYSVTQFEFQLLGHHQLFSHFHQLFSHFHHLLANDRHTLVKFSDEQLSDSIKAGLSQV